MNRRMMKAMEYHFKLTERSEIMRKLTLQEQVMFDSFRRKISWFEQWILQMKPAYGRTLKCK